MAPKESDPRRPDRVRPIKRAEINVDELPPDLLTFGSIGFGLVGMLMRSRLTSFAACLCCLGMLSNMRYAEVDVKQVLTSVTFAVSGLCLNHYAYTQGAAILSVV